ncbi:MAG: TetR/AcrR family transcriptional regulator [Bacteroidales bacterium]|nr:TetR/AcrR family transcriptional regulator [Bacteroidales bacterium]
MGTSERKKREKQKRRESIIDAAEKVFFSRGFDTATMDDIAKKSELSKGTLYLYFKSKEDIHLAVAIRAINILNSLLPDIGSKKDNAIDKLKKLAATFISFAGKFPGHLKSILYVESLDFRQLSLSREELKDVIFRETPVRMVMELVEQGVNEKIIRSDIPPGIIANTLWSQMLGMYQFVTIQRGLFEMVDMETEELLDASIELVLNGIRS